MDKVKIECRMSVTLVTAWGELYAVLWQCCNYLNSWPWSTWSTDCFRRCSRHAWLHEWDYVVNSL